MFMTKEKDPAMLEYCNDDRVLTCRLLPNSESDASLFVLYSPSYPSMRKTSLLSVSLPNLGLLIILLAASRAKSWEYTSLKAGTLDAKKERGDSSMVTIVPKKYTTVLDPQPLK